MAQITIMGLDIIGTSLGLALRKAEPSTTLVGVESDPHKARRAQQEHAVERVERWADKACKDAALVIVTEPISRLRDAIESIAASLPQGCVVTSIAPLVAPVLAWAEELLPPGVSFVAGHLILDPTKPTDALGPELFQQAQYCVVPSVKANAGAMELVSNLAATIGAQPFFLDAAEHDGLVTAVEGLPGLLGAALMSASASASSWRDMRRVAGPTFAQITAGADAEPTETVAALRANRQNLARWLEMYGAKLGEVRAALLAEDAEPLTRMLADAQEARARWLHDHQSGCWDKVVETPKVDRGTIFGNLLWPQRRPLEEDKRKR